MRKIKIRVNADSRGELYVIEKCLPFVVKRLYYIKNMNSESRGFHRHIRTVQAILAINGSFRFNYQFPEDETYKSIFLDSPNEFVVIPPECFHFMTDFSSDCIILVLASEEYDKNDYITKPYNPINN